MVTERRDIRVCDVLVDGEKCGEPASVTCAHCGCDMCDTEHTHDYDDGGHMDHAISVVASYFSYGGDYKFYICPKCCISTGIKKMIDKHGVRIDGTGGYHSGDGIG